MINILNCLYKSEMPPVRREVANLGSHAIGGRYTMTVVFYHVSVVPQSEQSLKIVGIGS